MISFQSPLWQYTSFNPRYYKFFSTKNTVHFKRKFQPLHPIFIDLLGSPSTYHSLRFVKCIEKIHQQTYSTKLQEIINESSNHVPYYTDGFVMSGKSACSLSSLKFCYYINCRFKYDFTPPPKYIRNNSLFKIHYSLWFSVFTLIFLRSFFELSTLCFKNYLKLLTPYIFQKFLLFLYPYRHQRQHLVDQETKQATSNSSSKPSPLQISSDIITILLNFNSTTIGHINAIINFKKFQCFLEF